jgi:hypothetical protein
MKHTSNPHIPTSIIRPTQWSYTSLPPHIEPAGLPTVRKLGVRKLCSIFAKLGSFQHHFHTMLSVMGRHNLTVYNLATSHRAV